MKQKILEALKTKFDGVKDDVLDRIATKGAKTISNEDEITTYVEGVTFQQVVESYADSRATEAQKTAISNYEKKHNIKDGKAIEQPKPTEPKPAPGASKEDDVPEWAKPLFESSKAIVERLNQMDGERTAKSRKAQLDEVLKDMPDNVKVMYTANFDRYNFKDDEDFGTFLEETKKSATSFANELKTKSGIVTPPKSGGKATGGTISPAVKERIDAQANQTTQSAIKG